MWMTSEIDEALQGPGSRVRPGQPHQFKAPSLSTMYQHIDANLTKLLNLRAVWCAEIFVAGVNNEDSSLYRDLHSLNLILSANTR